MTQQGADVRRDESDEEGVFELRGVPIGEVRLSGSLKGRLNPEPVEFELHDVSSLRDGQKHYACAFSSTIALDKTRFLTVFGTLVDSWEGREHANLLGVRWHVEGDLVP